MSFIDLRELNYPVLDAEGELVALFLLKEMRDDYVTKHNDKEENPDFKLVSGQYVDFAYDVSVKAE